MKISELRHRTRRSGTLGLVTIYALLTCVGHAFAGEANSSLWTSMPSDNGATAANCSDCNENISVLVTCRRGEDMREIHLMILEQRNDQLANKAAAVVAKANGQAVALTGTYTEPGLAGPYPIIRVSKSDPFFEFLSNVDFIVFAANETSAKVSMKRSRQAITRMNKACK